MKFVVNGQEVKASGFPSVIASDSIDFLFCEFVFKGTDWDGLTVVAQFAQNKSVWSVILDEKNSCTLPSEIGTGKFTVSLFGQKADSSIRATTNTYSVKVVQSGFTSTAETPIPPTPDLYAQLLAKIEAGGGGGGGGTTYEAGDNISIVDGRISVLTATEVEENNTKPITAGAVFAEVGNIDILLATI